MLQHRFYISPNNSHLTFTFMPQQLFLFDNEPQKESLPLEGKEALLPAEDSADEAEGLAPVEFNELAATADNPEAEPFTDPFITLQQKQQDKIETMLLMPNKKRGRKSFKDMDEEAILIDVPEDEVLYQKQYYPTRVVAEWFGISTTQLLAWENEFSILKPKKNGRGDRLFRPEDVKNLKLIYHLIRRRKFTLQGAKQYFEENKKRLNTTIQLTESLHKFKQFLLELKAISG